MSEIYELPTETGVVGKIKSLDELIRLPAGSQQRSYEVKSVLKLT